MSKWPEFTITVKKDLAKLPIFVSAWPQKRGSGRNTSDGWDASLGVKINQKRG